MTHTMLRNTTSLLRRMGFEPVLDAVNLQMLLLKMRRSHAYLAQIKHEQEATFKKLKGNFLASYNDLRKHNVDAFTTPFWKDSLALLERVFLPRPAFSFLRNSIVRKTLFVVDFGKYTIDQLAFLEEKIPNRELKTLLQEDYVGNPILVDSEHLASFMSIQHLYHLVRFLDRVQCNLHSMETIVEWGGGYGNMAKIFQRLKYTAPTYIIIDIPLMSCVQWLYLSTILGEESVNLLRKPEDTIHTGELNLMPISFLDRHRIDADLFISTWALSESSRYSQDYVISHNWFDSKHILLAYQDSNSYFPGADRVGMIAAGEGAVIEDMKYHTGNHYAFR